jgi:hypothetical protein
MSKDNKQEIIPITPIELEVVNNELAVAVQQEGIEPASAQELLSRFAPVFAQAKNICKDAAQINVTDATQVSTIKRARALRLSLRGLRVEADHIRKKLKEDSLRRGKAIQGVYNIIEYAIAPVEERLLEHEQFAERAEAARIEKLKTEREAVLSEYVADLSFYRLGEMSEEAWKQLLAGAKAAHEARIAAELKAEQERVAKAKAEAEERERIRLENERLKKEAEQRERALAEERRKAEAERRAAEEKTRKERAAAEAARRAAEENARKEREEVERKAREEREALLMKAEAEKRAAEEKARKDREAIEARAEAEKVERERVEAELRKAREEREEAERRAQAEAEKKQRAEETARRRAARAPDREKLKVFADDVRKLAVPSASTDEGRAVFAKIKRQVEEFALWVEWQGETLS